MMRSAAQKASDPTSLDHRKLKKTLIPWRKDPEGSCLRQAVFKAVMIHQPYLHSGGKKSTQTWSKTIDTLFEQPELQTYERCKDENIHKIYKNIVEEKTKFLSSI